MRALEVLEHLKRDYTPRIIAEARRLRNLHNYLIGRRELQDSRRSRSRYRTYARQRSALLERLKRANPAAMLTDPGQLLRIREAVSQPWRSLFLGPRPRDIEGHVRLLAYNLDWYLGPSERLLRGEWIWRLLQYSLALVLLVSLLSPELGWGKVYLAACVLGMLPALIAARGRSLCYRTALQADVLEEYLREHFSAQRHPDPRDLLDLAEEPAARAWREAANG